MNSFIAVLILIVNCVVCAFSQVLLKKAALKDTKSILEQYLNIQVITAYGIFFIVLMINSILMRYLPLLIISPISEALPFVFSIIFGFIFFHERITKRKIIGIVLIAAGIYLIV